MFNSKKRTTNYTTVNNTSTVNQQEGQLNLAQNSALNGNVHISNGVIESNQAMADTAKESFGFGERALELGSEAVLANGAVSQFALEESLNFGQSALEQNLDLSKRSMSFSESLVNQNTANSSNTLLAIKELAKSAATGGEYDMAQQSKEVTIFRSAAVIVCVIAVVLYLMTKGK